MAQYTNVRAQFIQKNDLIHDRYRKQTFLVVGKDITSPGVILTLLNIDSGLTSTSGYDRNSNVNVMRYTPETADQKVENPSEPAADKSDDQKLVDHLYQRGEHEAVKRLAKLTGVVSFHDDWTLLSALHKDGSELSSAARGRILNLKTLLHQIHLSAVHGDNVKWIEELVRAELEKH